MPRFERLANSRRARSTLKLVSGSMVGRRRAGPAAMTARSSCVTALSAPTEKTPTRPVSLAAPRMVAVGGAL